MTAGHEAIAAAANRLADQLPATLLRSLAEVIAMSPPGQGSAVQARIVGVIPHAFYRTLASDFLCVWEREATGLGPETIALALVMAAQVQESRRSGQTVELVVSFRQACKK